MQLRQFVDKVFVLNLFNSTERKKTMLEMFKEMGLQEEVDNGFIEFYEAVPIPSIDEETLEWMKKEEKNDFYSLAVKKVTPGSFNCANEHYRIWNIALQRGYKRILVLEDDVAFIREQERIIKALSTMPEDFEILHIEGFYWPLDDEYSNYEQVVREAKGWESSYKMRLWNTGGLIFSERGLQNLIKQQKDKFMYADYYTFLRQENCYFYEYPLLIQRRIASDNNAGYINCQNDANIYMKYINESNYYL